MPYLVRDPVTINVASGNYAGAFFNHAFKPRSASVGAYYVLQGAALTSVTPASGSATGTATSAIACANGPPLVQASLSDSGATWTTDDFQGFILETTGGTGSGQLIPILHNTATLITLAGCWVVTPNNTTTYAIRKWNSIINTSGGSPPTFLNAGSANFLGFWGGQDNSRIAGAALYYVDRMRVSLPSGSQAETVINANVLNQNSRFDSVSTGVTFNIDGTSRWQLNNSVGTSTNGTVVSSTSQSGMQGIRVANSLLRTGATGGSNSAVYLNGTSPTNGPAQIFQSAVLGTNTGLRSLISTFAGANVFLQTVTLECVSSTVTTVGLYLLSNASSSFNIATTSAFDVDSLWFNGCFYGIRSAGYNVSVGIDKTTMTGTTAGSIGISAHEGANVRIDTATTMAGYTTDFNIDGITSTYAALQALSPASIRSLSQGGGVLYGASPF